MKELAPLMHSRHAHACGTYHLGDTQVGLGQLGHLDHLGGTWSAVNISRFSFFNLIAQMLIVAGGFHLGQKLKSTEVVL